MYDQEQIDALKAQVNCLREMLTTITTSYGFYTSTVAAINDLIKATPEQCLAEHDARVIEKLKTRFSFWIRTSPETHIYVEDKESDGVFDSFPQFLAWYVKELREQAK